MQLITRAGVGLLGFRQHHQALGTSNHTGRREYCDTTTSYAGDVADGLFQFLRIDIASGTNDDVLDAPGDKDLTVRHISEVARFQPVTVEQAIARLRVAIVTACGGGPTEL